MVLKHVYTKPKTYLLFVGMNAATQ